MTAVIAFLIPSVLQAATPLTVYLLPVPCRILDTRIVNGPIQANEIFIFSVEEWFSPLQGGVSDCYVPVSAQAVKISIKGRSTTAPYGYFRVFNADGSASGTYSSLQIDSLAFDAAQIDVPVGGNLLVAIHSIVEAHAIVDLVGWFE